MYQICSDELRAFTVIKNFKHELAEPFGEYNLITKPQLMFNCSLPQIFDQPITWQQLGALGHVDMVTLEFKLITRMGRKGDLRAL